MCERPSLLDAEGEDVGMLQEQQRVGNAIGLAVLDQLALQLQPVRVGNGAEPPDVEWRAGVPDAVRPTTRRTSRCPSSRRP